MRHPGVIHLQQHLTLAAVDADNEKRLVKKCRELNTEIVGNAAKVQTALKLSEEDQQTIVALKKEIEKAWKMVDASHEKVCCDKYRCLRQPQPATTAGYRPPVCQCDTDSKTPAESGAAAARQEACMLPKSSACLHT